MFHVNRSVNMENATVEMLSFATFVKMVFISMQTRIKCVKDFKNALSLIYLKPAKNLMRQGHIFALASIIFFF